MRISFDEEGRLDDLKSYAILDTPPELGFDRIADLVASVCETPFATVTLVDETRQWFKSSVGFNICETPREVAFCGHVVQSGELLVVEDAALDERFSRNPLVTGKPGIRFYAGAPLISPAGYVLGSLAVSDTRPRMLTPVQLKTLRTCAEQVVTLLELRRAQSAYARVQEQREQMNSSLRLIAGQVAKLGGWQISLPSLRVSWSDEVSAILDVPEHMSLTAGMSMYLYAPEYWEQVYSAFQECIRHGTPYDLEVEAITYKERRIWVRLICHAVRAPSGEIIALRGAYQDITDRKNAESTLIEVHEGLIEAQRIGQMGSWSYDISTDRLRFSEEGMRIFGGDTTLPYVSNAQMLRLLHPDDRERVKAEVSRAKAGDGSFVFEHRVLWPDGQIRFVRTRGEVVFGPDNRPVRISGTVQDITERILAENALHRSESRFMHLANAMPQIVWTVDEKGTISFINQTFSDVTGRQPDEGPINWADWVHPDDFPRARDAWYKAFASGKPYQEEYRLYSRIENAYRWHIARAVPIRDEQGNITQWYGTATDHHANKLAAIQLEHSNRALQTLSRCNEALLRIENEAGLLEQICHIAKDVGGYRMCWVGYVDDAKQNLMPMAYSGDRHAESFVARDPFTLAPGSPLSVTSIGQAIRTAQPVVYEDLAARRHLSPFIEGAISRGYVGVVTLPLRDKENTFGVLVLYHGEVRKVSEEELQLLQELADNLAFGITNLRAKALQQRTERAIVRIAAGVTAESGTEFFKQLTLSMTDALGADIGIAVRLLPGTPKRVRTLSAVIDGEIVDDFDYGIDGTPCNDVLAADEWTVLDKAAELYPLADFLCHHNARSYVGRRLDDSNGNPVGVMFVIFRKPLQLPSFVTSTLKIFVDRAAAELKRQEIEAVIRDQASLLEKAQDAIVVSSIDHRILFWNKSAERLYGWSREEALGMKVDKMLYERGEQFQQLAERVLAGGEWRGEHVQRRKDGSSIVVEGHWTLVRDEEDHPKSILSINTDITQRKAAEQEIHKLAFYDQLTALPNRQLMLDRLQQAMAVCRRQNKTGALMFIDLDNFKTLNDTLGHDKGDELLRHVGARLITCVRECDTVARMSGDEFVIILQGLDSDVMKARAQADAVGTKIMALLNEPYQLNEYEHHSTPSIGVVLFRGVKRTIDELLKRADLAMYQAKASGKNAIRFFDPAMQAAVTMRIELEEELRIGLKINQFALHYQPQVDSSSRITGVEALVRWHHPIRGLVPPASFIPVAEESGLILPLGEWILESACRQLAAWADKPLTSNLSISVNVSSRQFRHARFVEQVLAILDRTGANPRLLKLELTESVLVDDVEDVKSKMQALKARGIGFSTDDFGTGYSSLSYLKSLPLDQLKIDRSFVRDILTDANDAAIVRTIVALGKSLGLAVIAEGVETVEQLDFLVSNGCQSYQGYLFSKPLPAKEFEAFASSHFRQEPLQAVAGR